MTSIEDKLKEKITSREQMPHNAYGSCLTQDTYRPPTREVSGYASHNMPWWWQREMLRMEHGVYPATDVLVRLNATMLGIYALHVSTTDNKQIAYTPSREYGEADRQLATSLGKFLAKYFPTADDNYVRALVADHEAEACATYEIAYDGDTIESVYRGLRGDTGCMRYSAAQYNVIGVHPSRAYEAPGLGVAYIKIDREGAVAAARAVVWTNPEDPTDKRYVRIYGAPVLKSLLERDGFRMGDLNGARIKKIPYPALNSGGRKAYVVPYLDGPGGEQSHIDGSYVIDKGDPDYLYLVGQKEYNDMSWLDGRDRYIVRAKSTSASVQLALVPSPEWVSDLTGVTYSNRTGADNYANPILYLCPITERVLSVAVGELRYIPRREAYTRIDGEFRAIYIGPTTKVFAHLGLPYVELPDNRAAHGYVKLSERHYPEGGYTLNDGLVTLPDGERIRKADCVLMVREDGTSEKAHINDVRADRKNYTKCTLNAGAYRVFIHRKSPTLRRTTYEFGDKTRNDVLCTATHIPYCYTETTAGEKELIRTSDARSFALYGVVYWRKAAAGFDPAGSILSSRSLSEVINSDARAELARLDSMIAEFSSVPLDVALHDDVRDAVFRQACKVIYHTVNSVNVTREMSGRLVLDYSRVRATDQGFTRDAFERYFTAEDVYQQRNDANVGRLWMMTRIKERLDAFDQKLQERAQTVVAPIAVPVPTEEPASDAPATDPVPVAA